MYIILVLAILVVVATITAGVVIRAKEKVNGGKKLKTLMKCNLSVFVPVMAAAIIMMVPQVANAATNGTVTSGSGLGFIAAALSTGIGTIGAGYAVAAVGSSALGAVSEDPKILGKTLIFVGLAEGIAIYGLIISIMILGKL